MKGIAVIVLCVGGQVLAAGHVPAKPASSKAASGKVIALPASHLPPTAIVPPLGKTLVASSAKPAATPSGVQSVAGYDPWRFYSYP